MENHIFRFLKKIFLDFLYIGAKCIIGIKIVLVFIAKHTFLALGRFLRLIGERPLVALYRRFLGLQFRLTRLGTPLKNPILYALASKTLGYSLLFVLAGLFITANISIQGGESDIFNPNNIISQMVINEEDMIVLEEGNSSLAGTDGGSPISGVKASPSLGTDSDVSLPQGDLGDISMQSGALLKPVLPTTSEGTTSSDAIRTYTVESGDTLSGIAHKFGLQMSTIAWANDLITSQPLQEGKKLTILPVDGILYRVRKGDSLTKIAQTYDSDSQEIATYNRLADNESLRSGITILIPHGSVSSSLAQAGTKSSGLLGTIKNIITGKNNTVSKPSTISAAGSTISHALGMIWPTTANRVTQYFSWRHTGVDIAGPITNKIYAAASGTVVISQGGYNGGYGNTIVIDHGNGLRTRYGHASKLLVSAGQYVTKGQLIAMVGSTGNSTGPHLHFEVLVNGTRVNPLGYIR